MLGCSCVFMSCLLSVTLLLSKSEGLWLTSVTPKETTGSGLSYRMGPDGLQCLHSVGGAESGSRAPSGEERSASKPTERLHPLDQTGSTNENKRRKGFTGGNTPLDRLSISNMDTKVKKSCTIAITSRSQFVTAPPVVHSIAATEEEGGGITEEKSDSSH
ncbi:hypothetical protein JZ751_025741 [Albula glossodonta]|uniref:Uncharacterized protein n=1 Tax=Albula glossodonta TaxID=121402 RepID=A0A8T2NFH7_9TELE|nr:hypothetical protein JZ751_025741 [Albula glossodonta]